MEPSISLYKSLCNSSIPDKDLLKKDKADFVKKIKSLDKEGSNILYSLIKCYESENKINLEFEMIKEGMRFDFDTFPVKLKHVLYRFIKLHIIKLEEDKLKEVII